MLNKSSMTLSKISGTLPSGTAECSCTELTKLSHRIRLIRRSKRKSLSTRYLREFKLKSRMQRREAENQRSTQKDLRSMSDMGLSNCWTKNSQKRLISMTYSINPSKRPE